jgi:hypothetical protein
MTLKMAVFGQLAQRETKISKQVHVYRLPCSSDWIDPESFPDYPPCE